MHTTSRGEALLGRLAHAMRPSLPQGVTPRYFDGFIRRNKPMLTQVLDDYLGELDRRALGHRQSDSASDDFRDLPEHWTPAKRTEANIQAMQVAANIGAASMTPGDRAILAQYSGWGGLSIKKAASRFPTGFPVPESQGLIHEYYTPSKVTREVARVITPLLPGLERDGQILALEPAAGIGRFLEATQLPAFDKVRWNVVEYSQLSALMLAALRADLAVYQGSFEAWVTQHGHEVQGDLSLILANPPYGPRGGSITDDPDRSYREKMAYAYFLRRGLDLLAEGGLGVYLIPAGFLSGRGKKSRQLRETILKRHHLASAYRLPSKLFPGANLVTDLLFFRARGGELDEVDPGDEFILDGLYFKDFPRHILGKEVGKDKGEDDQTKLPRWGYEVQGEFTKLPDLVERPLCGACVIAQPVPRAKAPKRSKSARSEGNASPSVKAAQALGLRVDRYLTLAATEESQEAKALHGELKDALLAWVSAYGNPSIHKELRGLANRGDKGASRFLAAFRPSGQLIAAIEKAPVISLRYRGRNDDLIAQAEFLYRTNRRLKLLDIAGFRKRLGARRIDPKSAYSALFRAGWALDKGELFPPDVYLSGDLWPKYDRAKALSDKGDAQAKVQMNALLGAMKLSVFEDIDALSPRGAWLPLEIINGWLTENLNGRLGPVKLERVGGLLSVEDVEYGDLGEAPITREVRICIGWMNHDRIIFKPKRASREESLDEARLRQAKEWDRGFKAWVEMKEERKVAVESAYNRRFRGFVSPEFTNEPFSIARWVTSGVRPHPHQYGGARRILHNRGGLLAFDVGVGKTYTGIAVVAKAREEGWAKRPVILVPNSIVWKWYADIKRVLPDYRIGVVGSRQKVITRGPRKGYLTSETDSPEQRANTWTRFQGGEFDVVLLTYSAMPRTQMNMIEVRAYAAQVEGIEREVTIAKRNAEATKEPTERQKAIIQQGTDAWVAEMMELPRGWKHDPGVEWDDLGVDLLMVDEAQNFKNLYMPEAREGGVPRFMGNSGSGSKRAWQLDFRAASVRKRTGGAGIVLLSATPAKNSPLEFYNLIQFIDGNAWSRMGILDPEQFIDRYLRTELKQVIDSTMSVVERSAVVGFQNLHELREVIFRYGDFKTAEDVGLKLPEPQVEIVEVDMDPAQEEKYDEYVDAIEEALDSDDPKEKGSILGYLARMALVAIHSQLDEKYTWKTAHGVNPHSPKFDAMAERVAANRTCGHIVFVDNIAAHRWVKEVLVRSGVPEHRIATLNAVTAKASADRQRIAQGFNGDADEGILPKYDVVIANAIAYEGIDLQTRTCAIHHLDLPWEPATLQQRNGRGVRQGNTLQTIAIYYYFARRSQDGLRFNLIQGKLGWMTELLKSQKRDTNNPAAQMDMGPEEVLLLISRDPAKTKALLDEIRAKREEESRIKLRDDAVRMMRSANARFRKAERVKDPEEAVGLRSEGESLLKELASVDPKAWPWAPWMGVARSQRVFVANEGHIVWEGLRVGTPSPYNKERLDYAEFGTLSGTTIGIRSAHGTQWRTLNISEVNGLKLTPEAIDPPWPEENAERLESEAQRMIRQRIGRMGDWPALNWHRASSAFITRVWDDHNALILDTLTRTSSYYAGKQRIPLLKGGRMRLTGGASLAGGELFPPSAEGWARFLMMAPESGLTFTELKEAGRYWWDRAIPQDLLSAARRAGQEND